MKSERRHELQHNALADWLESTGKSIQPYLNHIFLVGLIVVIALLGYTWWSRTSTAEKSEAWNEYYLGLDTNDPEALNNVIENFKNSTAANMASALTGDFRLNRGGFQIFQNKATGELELTKAMRSYESTLRGAKNPMLLARATFGLGRANESKCELDEAERFYREVVANWPDSAYALMARERLDDLERLETKKFYDDFRSKFDADSKFSEELDIPAQAPAFDPRNVPEEMPADLPDLPERDAKDSATDESKN